jgi:hypothetical protein
MAGPPIRPPNEVDNADQRCHDEVLLTSYSIMRRAVIRGRSSQHHGTLRVAGQI